MAAGSHSEPPGRVPESVLPVTGAEVLSGTGVGQVEPGGIATAVAATSKRPPGPRALVTATMTSMLDASGLS